MGQSPSNAFSMGNGNGPSRRKSFRSPFTRRKKHKHLLSATFQAPCSNNFETLNINTATVEQFMTLPGISRRIAQSIVEHRNALGGRFQRVDDLALVSGIGAEKLQEIRPEICVKRSTRSLQGSSTVSSRTPSLDSILSEQNSTNSTKIPVNVNTSTVFQLQQINGINQEIAANLVEYRNRKGIFKSLDDLIKVKGVSHVRLSAIRSALCVDDKEKIQKTPRLSQTLSLSTCPSSTPIRNGYKNIGHRKSMSMPIKMNSSLTNGFKNAPVNDIFDLLGAYSHRPVVEDNFNYKRNGHASLRVASWNMDKMCSEKSANLGVKEVLCRTILENKLSILCLQEILEPSALHQICDELNCPTLRRVVEWKDNKRNWKYFTNSSCTDGGNNTNNNNINNINGLGFIYDANMCDIVQSNCFDIPLDAVNSEDTSLIPTAYLATFKLSDWTCCILNTYLRYYDLTKITNVISSVESFLMNNQTNNGLRVSDIYFVVGDFSEIDYDADRRIKIQKNGIKKAKCKKSNLNFENLGFYSLFESQSTAFSNNDEEPKAINARSIVSSCNILCRDRMPSIRSAFRDALYKTKSPLSIFQQHDLSQVPSITNGDKLCGYWGTVRQGLCHMAIPRGWTWGGPASEHCPIWVEVYKRKIRSTPMKSHSLDLTNGDTTSTCRSLGRESLNSSVSYQLLNGHTSSIGNLNASSDSVFLSNDKC